MIAAMETMTLILFAATVLPLICTPGPDMLFVAAQAVSGGTAAGLRATAGVCLGYVVHSTLVALGIAALIAASPVLFDALRWLGVGYLVWLGLRLLRHALAAGRLTLQDVGHNRPLARGFLTALLNPKGMMIYMAILPQFMTAGAGIAPQAAALSVIFIGLCGLVYTGLSLAIGIMGRRWARGGALFGGRGRRWAEAAAGAMLIAAAGRLAAN
ncbi:lysine transporter LysE [Tistrella bauzanensis]|uniref:Lysine transporter LysE n=2 Tax=Tistrella bauzanensis TaxID=657419 RepID=A0ABQ1IBV7_9PROT|nr:lysine transporter LysE [Tistrella bauzanensis]